MAKILLIDDSRLSRAMVSGMLLSAGHVVVEAEDGLQGLAACEKHGPDCIVVDLLMPQMGGHEFLRRLRNGGAEIPVIVATADIQETSRSLCEEFGVSGFLNKPAKGDELVACVETALAHCAELPNETNR